MPKANTEDDLDKIFHKYAAWNYSTGKQGTDEEQHFYTLKHLNELKKAIRSAFLPKQDAILKSDVVEAKRKIIEQAKRLIGKYSIHTPKGQPKDTLARRTLMRQLDKLGLTEEEEKL